MGLVGLANYSGKRSRISMPQGSIRTGHYQTSKDAYFINKIIHPRLQQNALRAGRVRFVHATQVSEEAQPLYASGSELIPGHNPVHPSSYFSANKLNPLCCPHILSNTFDPVTQLIDARIPLPQPQSHVVNLLHVKDLRLHPVDPCNFRHLVNASS